MKIIGIQDSKTYLAIVEKVEIEKVFDKYYGKFGDVKVGDVIELSAGYNFRDDIKRACNDMTQAFKAFEKAQSTLLRFASMVQSLESDNALKGE